MNRTCTLLLLVALAGLTAPALGEGIAWQPSVEQAARLAQQSNRLVLIHFYSTNCPPCRALEADVFNQPGLPTALEAHFVPVKINVDQQPLLADKYNVERWPTDVVAAPDGHMIARLGCPHTPAAYLAQLERAAFSNSTMAARRASDDQVSQIATAQLTAAPLATAPLATAPVANAPVANAPVATAPPSIPTINGNSANINASLAASAQRVEAAIHQNQVAQADSNARWANEPRSAAAQPIASQQPVVLRPTAVIRVAYPPLSESPNGQPASVQQPQPGSSMGAAAMTPNMPMSVTADTGLAPRPAAVPQQGFAPAAVAPQNTVPAYSTGPQPPITQLNNPWLAPQAAAPAAILTPTNQFSPNVALPPAGAPPAAGAPSIAPPTSTALRPGLPPLGLDGFSPVTLCEKQIWQRGVEQFGAIHQGRLYLFTSAAEQQRFLDNPEKYSPVMSGNDPVVALDQRQNVPGTRQNGYFYNGRIYLFASEATQKQFKQNPTRYSAPALQAEAPRLPLR